MLFTTVYRQSKQGQKNRVYFGLSFVDVVTFLLDCSPHDITEILRKLALNINQSYQMLRDMSTLPTRLLRMSSVLVGVA